MSFKCLTAEKLYNKDTKLSRSDVQHLQEWTSKQPHLPKIEDYQFCIFLQCLDYSIELTKTTIDKYFTLRTLHPEVFQSLPKDVFISTSKILGLSFLPQRAPDGSLIFFLKLLDPKAENFNYFNFVRYLIMLGSLWFHQRGYIPSFVTVCDAKNTALGHITRLDVMGVKHLVDLVQTALPVRLKSLNFINSLSIAEKAIYVAKPFMKTEIFNLFQFHSSPDTLYKIAPKEILPVECGGDGISLEELRQKNVDWALKNYDFFEWHDKQVVDETKRIGRRSDIDQEIDGSFRKLEID